MHKEHRKQIKAITKKATIKEFPNNIKYINKRKKSIYENVFS